MFRPFDLEVRDGGTIARAPVDDPRRPVDPALFVERNECRHHGADVTLVHGEAEAGPVQRRAEDAVLAHYGFTDLAVPLIDARLESLTAELLFGHAFGSQLLLDDVLRGDRGVVRAGEKQHLIAGHAPVARADVL